MRFRCPNCNCAVDVGDLPARVEETVSEVTCPSCRSRFGISGQSAPTQIPAEGLTIGRFEVREILGEGAFGTVYRAWDPQLQRSVAVKVAREDRVRASKHGDLLGEARMAAGLRHHGVVRIFDVGPHGQSIYIASELIEGINLANWLKSKRPTIKQSCTIVMGICDGIEAAHKAGIVHRDLKPGNVLMDLQDQPHVTDFGLASHSSPVDVTIAADGAILGTPAYMAPEQARGESSKVGPTTDVYAIGNILYELLTGERPFRATDSRTVMYRIQTEVPRAPRSLNRDIPVDVERICLQALEKQPDRRYASAHELAEDLKRYLDGFPVRARQYGPVQKLAKLVARNRMLSAAVAVAFLAVSGLTALALFREQPIVVDSQSVTVAIQTNPPFELLQFERHDEFLRVPDRHAQIVTLQSPEASTVLTPGLYRVRAWGPAESFHEVWRTVPDRHAQLPVDQFYPHKTWTRSTDNTVVLPEFKLFRDSDVIMPMVEVEGGMFTMGLLEDNHVSVAHRHEVGDLLCGVNEVTIGEFRTILDAAHSVNSESSCLTAIDAVFGDRSSEDPMLPITGYPRDVAILFCEHAGGRLPDIAEWEFIASQRGKSEFSTGSLPPTIPLESWSVTSTAAPTLDVGLLGIRGLCSNAAELTDSVNTDYPNLFPEQISTRRDVRLEADVLAAISQFHEVRGGDPNWVAGKGMTAAPSAKTRAAVAAFDGSDSISNETRGNYGWRLFRSRKNRLMFIP